MQLFEYLSLIVWHVILHDSCLYSSNSALVPGARTTKWYRKYDVLTPFTLTVWNLCQWLIIEIVWPVDNTVVIVGM